MEGGAELLQALQQGDNSAWDRAFRELYPLVLHAALHPLAGLSPSEAEDVAIDTLTKLVPKVREVEEWEGVRALAVTMASRAAISEKRKRTAQKRGSGQVQSIEQLREESQGAFEPCARLVEGISSTDLKELSLLLADALAGLEPVHRSVIEDFILEKLSYRELSEKHGLPMGSIGVVISRGLKKVRDQLGHRPQLLKEIRAYLR